MDHKEWLKAHPHSSLEMAEHLYEGEYDSPGAFAEQLAYDEHMISAIHPEWLVMSIDWDEAALRLEEDYEFIDDRYVYRRHDD